MHKKICAGLLRRIPTDHVCQSLVSKPAHTPYAQPSDRHAQASRFRTCGDAATYFTPSAAGHAGCRRSVGQKAHIGPYVGRIIVSIGHGAAKHAAAAALAKAQLEFKHGTVSHVTPQVSDQHFATQRNKSSIAAAAPAAEPQAAFPILKTLTVHTERQNYNFPTETARFCTCKS